MLQSLFCVSFFVLETPEWGSVAEEVLYVKFKTVLQEGSDGVDPQKKNGLKTLR